MGFHTAPHFLVRRYELYSEVDRALFHNKFDSGVLEVQGPRLAPKRQLVALEDAWTEALPWTVLCTQQDMELTLH